uniref:Secreted protein n=1 Tax=Caenorhabditis tropicalis TaxID=1561998 RepID=A0A1I7T9X4_9PELO
MILNVFALFAILGISSGSIVSRDPPTESSTLIPDFPWLQNVAKIEFTTSKPRSAIRDGLVEEVKSGRIPKELVPFVNLTKIDELKKEHNETLDFIIRDEDVADVPDDDVEHRKVNTLTHDGNKTIITISDEARDDLYKHWMDQSLAGLMGAVVTNV